MDLGLLRDLRDVEVELALKELELRSLSGASILEVGAGAGWQAVRFSERGFHVKAIDVGEGIYTSHRVYPVIAYDGERIPFPDNEFDVIFTSNVLEHVSNFQKLQQELRRVLKEGGIAIHVVPTSTWRFWTIATYYPAFCLQFISNRLSPKDPKTSSGGIGNQTKSIREGPLGSLMSKIKLHAFPPRHGVRGNALSEMYYFSRHGWNRVFKKTGWKVEKRSSNALFYTGHLFLRKRLSVDFRRRLSRILGSSCHIYVLTTMA